MRGGIHQTSVSTRQRPGVPGMPVDISGRNDSILLINKDPQAVEVFTITINTATDDEDYGLDLTDPAASITIDAGTGSSTTTVAAALAVAWNANPIARAMGEASAAVAVLTITGVYPGVAFAVTEGENAAKMTLVNTTNAAEADTVPFGRAMISTAFETDYPDELGIIAKSSALSARVSTLAITYAAGEIYTVGLTVDGTRYQVAVLADTDDNTTATAIRAAINAMMPANTVIASGATNSVILTQELAGKFFEIDLGLVSGTTARMVLADTLNTPACDFNAVFAGVSQFTYDVETTVLPTSASADDVSYPANSGVTAMTRGAIWVESSETIVSRSPVYVELDGTGDNAGRFYISTSATRVKADKALSWRRAAHSGSDATVATLSVDLAA